MSWQGVSDPVNSQNSKDEHLTVYKALWFSKHFDFSSSVLNYDIDKEGNDDHQLTHEEIEIGDEK